MRIAIIGRSELLYNSAIALLENGHSIPLIITSKEAPEYKITATHFRELSEKINAAYIYSPSINHEEHLHKIKTLGAIDIAVSINYTGIISNDVIRLFEMGILNAHAGDLPRYRGNAPLAWAIINGEERAGLCIHKMIGNELDSGDIIAKDFFPIRIETQIGQLFDWMTLRTPDLIVEAITKLMADKNYIMETQSKDPRKALRCYPRSPEDGKIDWRNSAISILRLINASSEPFAGAFCEFQNEQLKIWRATLYSDQEQYLAVPGQVSAIQPDGSIVVITGQGKLCISEIEFKGSRTAPGEVIKSIRKKLR